MDLHELQIIKNFSACMNVYQKNNNIQGKCITNTSILYKIINKFPNLKERAKVIPVIAYYMKHKTDITYKWDIIIT